ncbi:hypothetical protein ADUPG1_007092 [Aduncisulcus paluster]|uniref:Alpha-type protein kinase domain-containing protein n=1 Tax=Aduncisulcus paluster TaxID=2918883 RepID=A0ABQ5KMB0_9EUKA|nr:hypothetical protein ADUPG1_007092 [Aduncisulcus paluster]
MKDLWVFISVMGVAKDILALEEFYVARRCGIDPEIIPTVQYEVQLKKKQLSTLLEERTSLEKTLKETIKRKRISYNESVKEVHQSRSKKIKRYFNVFRLIEVLRKFEIVSRRFSLPVSCFSCHSDVVLFLDSSFSIYEWANILQAEGMRLIEGIISHHPTTKFRFSIVIAHNDDQFEQKDDKYGKYPLKYLGFTADLEDISRFIHSLYSKSKILAKIRQNRDKSSLLPHSRTSFDYSSWITSCIYGFSWCLESLEWLPISAENRNPISTLSKSKSDVEKDDEYKRHVMSLRLERQTEKLQRLKACNTKHKDNKESDDIPSFHQQFKYPNMFSRMIIHLSRFNSHFDGTIPKEEIVVTSPSNSTIEDKSSQSSPRISLSNLFRCFAKFRINYVYFPLFIPSETKQLVSEESKEKKGEEEQEEEEEQTDSISRIGDNHSVCSLIVDKFSLYKEYESETSKMMSTREEEKEEEEDIGLKEREFSKVFNYFRENQNFQKDNSVFIKGIHSQCIQLSPWRLGVGQEEKEEEKRVKEKDEIRLRKDDEIYEIPSKITQIDMISDVLSKSFSSQTSVFSDADSLSLLCIDSTLWSRLNDSPETLSFLDVLGFLSQFPQIDSTTVDNLWKRATITSHVHIQTSSLEAEVVEQYEQSDPQIYDILFDSLWKKKAEWSSSRSLLEHDFILSPKEVLSPATLLFGTRRIGLSLPHGMDIAAGAEFSYLSAFPGPHSTKEAWTNEIGCHSFAIPFNPRMGDLLAKNRPNKFLRSIDDVRSLLSISRKCIPSSWQPLYDLQASPFSTYFPVSIEIEKRPMQKSDSEYLFRGIMKKVAFAREEHKCTKSNVIVHVPSDPSLRIIPSYFVNRIVSQSISGCLAQLFSRQASQHLGMKSVSVLPCYLICTGHCDFPFLFVEPFFDWDVSSRHENESCMTRKNQLDKARLMSYCTTPLDEYERAEVEEQHRLGLGIGGQSGNTRRKYSFIDIENAEKEEKRRKEEWEKWMVTNPKKVGRDMTQNALIVQLRETIESNILDSEGNPHRLGLGIGGQSGNTRRKYSFIDIENAEKEEKRRKEEWEKWMVTNPKKVGRDMTQNALIVQLRETIESNILDSEGNPVRRFESLTPEKKKIHYEVWKSLELAEESQKHPESSIDKPFPSSLTLSAFQHHVYNVSLGGLLVSDLKGWSFQSHIILSTPELYSSSKAYLSHSSKNRHKIGIAEWHSTHKCNYICSMMSFPSSKKYIEKDPKKHSEREIRDFADSFPPIQFPPFSECVDLMAPKLKESVKRSIRCVKCKTKVPIPLCHYVLGCGLTCHACANELLSDKERKVCSRCAREFSIHPQILSLQGKAKSHLCEWCRFFD